MFILSTPFHNHYLFHIFYLFVAYLHSFISLALFIHLFYPCAYSTLILNFNIKLVEKPKNINPYFKYIKLNIKIVGDHK